MRICVSVDDATARRLAAVSAETGREIWELAQCSIEEEARGFFRNRKDDPGRSKPKAGYTKALERFMESGSVEDAARLAELIL